MAAGHFSPNKPAIVAQEYDSLRSSLAASTFGLSASQGEEQGGSNSTFTTSTLVDLRNENLHRWTFGGEPYTHSFDQTVNKPLRETSKSLVEIDQTQRNNSASFNANNVAQQDETEVEPEDETDDDHSLGISEEPQNYERYELRPSVRAQPQAFTTWRDNDDSGDYDPKEGDTQLSRKTLKRKIPPTSSDNDLVEGNRAEEAPKHRKSISNNCRDEDCLLVSLRLGSEKGRLVLERWHQAECDEMRAASGRTSGPPSQLADVDALDLEFREQHRLRNRQELESQKAGNEEELDLTGHPEARGCKGCRELGEHCTLLEPAQRYPCEACYMGGVDCVLLVPPKRKRACEFCKNRRSRCSYLDNDEHGPPCAACAKYGFNCVAGPQLDPKRTRLTADGLPGTIHEPLSRTKRVKKVERSEIISKSASEDASRNFGVDHTLRNPISVHSCEEPSFPKTEMPALRCASDKSHGLDKDEMRTDQQDDQLCSKEPELQSKTATQHPEPINDRPIPASTTSSQGTVIKEIQTRLLYPIVFNYLNRFGSKPCHWCSDPLYGIFGTGHTRTIKVAERANGCYDEIGSRDTKGRTQTSRCCRDCTTSRIRIITCSKHVLRPISGVIPQSGEWEVAVNKLMNSTTNFEREKVSNTFCCICPGLAQYQCETPEPYLNAYKLGSAPSSQGCGLRLCYLCAYTLRSRHSMDLQDMTARLPLVPGSPWDMGLRADYSFFSTEGDLIRQLLTKK